MDQPYQVFDPLPPDQFDALKADIAVRGVLEELVVDEAGQLLDGHHRRQAWRELRAEGIDVPPYRSRVVHGLSEEGKLLFALKAGLVRRNLGPVAKGKVLLRYLQGRGVRLEERARNDLTGATVAAVAAELGIKERTAQRWIEFAKAVADVPELERRVDAGELSMTQALKMAKFRPLPSRPARGANPTAANGVEAVVVALLRDDPDYGDLLQILYCAWATLDAATAGRHLDLQPYKRPAPARVDGAADQLCLWGLRDVAAGEGTADPATAAI